MAESGLLTRVEPISMARQTQEQTEDTQEDSLECMRVLVVFLDQLAVLWACEQLTQKLHTKTEFYTRTPTEF